ncbi:MAG: SpoIIE family protein phosphatase [Armatimonadetes bacterium]|nr:SpoIIE family protein phosphatase [Armatimonadota bacterium]
MRKVELALSMLSELTEPSLVPGDTVRLGNIADRVAKGEPERVMVADRQGVIIADSKHELYDRTIAAIRTVKQSGRRNIARKGNIWEGAAPVRDYRGLMAGIVYVTFSTRPMDQALMESTKAVLTFAGVAILLGILVAYGLGRYLSASLVPLLAGIRRTASGNFQSSIPRTGMIELDEIGQAFNWMSGLVGRQVQILETLNQLATSLTAAKTLEQFDSALHSACSTLVEGSAFLLSGDPRTGVLTLLAEERPMRRVTRTGAAFLAANERRAIRIGRNAELQPGYEVAEGVNLDSGIVAPLVTPYGETVGVLVAQFDPVQRSSPDEQNEAAVLAVANLAAPILATLVRSWTQEKVLETLKEVLLPEAVPQPEGLELFACFEPAEAPSEFGGDYYDVLPLGEHIWGFAIGDVTGHGLDAGRYTAMAKYVVRSFALEYRSPAKTISQADKALAAQMDELHFVTILFAVLNVREQNLTYCCAGHPPGLLYSPASESFRELQAGGGLIGYGLSTRFEEETVNIQTGDLLLLYTDGILEARLGNEQYGMERLKAVVSDNARRSLKNIARAVTDDVRNFTGNLVRDDMALLLVRVVERPDGNQEQGRLSDLTDGES